MARIVVFGAGGRAGRRAVTEARRRGHQVTAVVRDPAKHAALTDGAAPDGGPDDSLVVRAGDLTDAPAVAALVAGHDAVIATAAVYGDGTDPRALFVDSAHALLDGVGKAGVGRLVVVGLSALLPDAAGVRMMDAPEFPAEFREFCLGHQAGFEVLRAYDGGSGPDVDWLYVSPAGDFDHSGPRKGGYRIAAHYDSAATLSYDDFAIALLDEIDTPRHHGVHLAVTEAVTDAVADTATD